MSIDYQTPVDPKSKITRDKFNAYILPDKLVEPGANPYGQQRNTQSQQKMVKFQGVDLPAGSEFKDKTTGKIKYLQADGSLK